MRFWRLAPLCIVTCLLIVSFNLSACPVNAQTAEPTAWGETPPLTLVWQSQYSSDAALTEPNDIAINSEGNIYVSTQAPFHIKVFDSDGNFIDQWGRSGSDDGEINLAAGIAVDAQDNVYVADFRDSRIEKYDSSGNFLQKWSTEHPAGPASVIVDQLGNLYVDNFNPHDHHIQKFDSSGELVTQWGSDGHDAGQYLRPRRHYAGC